MLWLAWKIANASAPNATGARAKPLTFLQAAAFQWVNPKAWIMALGAVTLYAPGQDMASLLWVALGFMMVNFPSVSIWAAMGVGLRRYLDQPGKLRAFNWTMAALLVASLIPVVLA
jgi:threonine/homoserine/homoserine lactone efflux protein